MNDCYCCRPIPGPSKHCPKCGFWERAGLPHDCDEVIAKRTAELLALIPTEAILALQATPDEAPPSRASRAAGDT